MTHLKFVICPEKFTLVIDGSFSLPTTNEVVPSVKSYDIEDIVVFLGLKVLNSDILLYCPVV